MAELQTAEEMAPELKVSARMLQRLAQRGEIPHYRIGRLLRFDREAVRAALGSGVSANGNGSHPAGTDGAGNE
jgi:excisionase family DNA binding protein